MGFVFLRIRGDGCWALVIESLLSAGMQIGIEMLHEHASQVNPHVFGCRRVL